MKIYLVHKLGCGYNDDSWTDFADMKVSAFSNKEDAIKCAAMKNADLICGDDYIFEEMPEDFFNLSIDSSKKEIYDTIIKVGIDKFLKKVMNIDECEPFSVTEMDLK